MGSLFSKDKKQKAEERAKVGSAPSRLEGLDGTSPPLAPLPAKRALTPDITSRAIETRVSPVAVSAADSSPSPASTTSPVEPQKPTIVVPEPLAARPHEPPSSSAPDAQPQPQAGDADADAALSPNGGDLTPTRRAPKKTDYVGAQTDGTKLAADLPAAVQVPQEASPWLAVLGESTVRSLYSPDWKTREHALQAVMRSINNVRWNAERAPEDVWATITQLLDKSLKDKVAPLFYSSLELLATLTAAYSTTLPYSVLTQGLEPLMPTLLHRVGNNNARIQETSIQALLTLANQPALGLAFLAPHALSVIPKKSSAGAAAASQMVGRLELITCMLNVQVQQQMGFGTAGRTEAATAAAGRGGGDALSAEEVVKFTRPALEMPDDKVRTAAVRLVAEVYRMRKTGGQPFEVEKLLGAGVKPALLQVLHRRFGEVDEEIAGGLPPGGAAGGGRAQVTNRDDMPVGPGISIRASGSFNRMGSALPPIAGRGGTLPALAVVGSSRGGSRPGTGPLNGGLDAGGKPPRTPLSPGGGGGGGPRGRTPPRLGRLGTAEGAGGGGGSLRGGVGSPLRNSRGGTPLGGGALLPGSMPGEGADGADGVMMIHSGGSTPVRGNSGQSARGGSGQGVRNSSSLKARTRGGGTPSGAALDDAEEQLIEYILNDEARAVV